MFTTGITGFSRILSQDTEGGGESGKKPQEIKKARLGKERGKSVRGEDMSSVERMSNKCGMRCSESSIIVDEGVGG